jgi:hypothetical protein
MEDIKLGLIHIGFCIDNKTEALDMIETQFYFSILFNTRNNVWPNY